MPHYTHIYTQTLFLSHTSCTLKSMYIKSNFLQTNTHTPKKNKKNKKTGLDVKSKCYTPSIRTSNSTSSISVTNLSTITCLSESIAWMVITTIICKFLYTCTQKQNTHANSTQNMPQIPPGSSTRAHMYVHTYLGIEIDELFYSDRTEYVVQELWLHYECG